VVPGLALKPGLAQILSRIKTKHSKLVIQLHRKEKKGQTPGWLDANAQMQQIQTHQVQMLGAQDLKHQFTPIRHIQNKVSTMKSEGATLHIQLIII
jgi:hypothetical protein